MTEVDDFLAHYGVKGMKWGVRKEEELVGRKNAATKSDDKDQRARAQYDQQLKRIQKELKAKGFNDLDSAVLKAKYETPPDKEPTSGLSKGQKVAIGVGIGVGVAALGYAAYKGGAFDTFRSMPLFNTNATAYSNGVDGLTLNWDADVKLSAGSVLKRISSVAEKEAREQGFYACFRDEDVTSYKAILPTFWPQWGVGSPWKGGYVNHYKAAVSVKAPSGKESFELFKDLVNNTPNFKEALMTHIPSNVGDSELKEYFKMFAKGWIDPDEPATKYFFNQVTSRGYNALIDFNDAGVLGKTPLRVIDGSIFEIIQNEKLDLNGMLQAAKAWTPDLIHMLVGGTTFNTIDKTLGERMSDVDDFLAHYGVKGMKWGKRRAAAREERKARNQKIIEARARHTSREQRLNAAIIDSSYAQSPEVKKRADNLIKKISAEILSTDDAEVGQRMTTGEKWATGIMAGVTVGSMAYVAANAVGKY